MSALSRLITTSFMALAVLLFVPGAADAKDDAREYRKLILDNGLRVLLASDPSVNTSSASMAVGIGANADPADAQGLAHFLEHMLFLANGKYPELNAYSDFLQSRGGSSNAYTSQDHTNYHFQVNHEALPEAIDRFAQFFISPTLDYEYAQREVMAVNSEHQKNTMDDTWRLMQLQRAHLRPGHPANKFSTGNAETLADAKEAVLRSFFESYYKPKNMALAVLSDRSLDDLERMVRERFADLAPGEPKAWSAPSDLLDESQGLRLLEVVPIKDLRQLKIFFEVPPQHAHALTKISNLVGLTLGDEGKGSLLSYLKARGLATFLSAGVGGTRYYNSCQVTVGLTPKGLEAWREVLKLCFAYTRVLQRSGFPRHVWEEAKTLAELEERYAARPEGTQAAIDLANAVLEHGLEVADRVAVTFEEPEPAAYQALVDALRPEQALVFLVAKGLETDKTETYYGTGYTLSVDEALVGELAEVEVPEELHLPLPNRFVPDDVALVPEQPVRIQQDGSVTLYYAQDTEFRRPKVALHLHILSPEAFASEQAAALTGLYAAMLQEQLNELAYPALMAGLSYSLQPTRKGLLLTVAGYSDSAFELLSIVGESLRGELEPAVFQRVLLRSLEAAKNFPLAQAYTVVSELSREVSLEEYVTARESVAVLEGATMAQLQAHVKKLLARTHIEGLCAGNLSGDQAREAVAKLRAAIGSEPFDPKQAHQDAVLWLGEPREGEPVDLVLREVGATDQACLRLEYQVGKSDVKLRMAAELIGRALRNPFYTEMRTRQKLGYIVFSGTYNRENVQSLVFLIQSGTHAPSDLQTRADSCIETLPQLFAQMPEAQFEAIRQSLIEDRRKTPKSIAEKAGLFWVGAFDKEGDFAWIDDEIRALEALDQEEVTQLIARTVAPDMRRRVIYQLRAAQHGPFEEAGDIDFETVGEGRTYLREKAGH